MEEKFIEVSKKYNLPLWMVREIWESQFRFVAETIKSSEKNKPDSFKGVLLRNFGKFYGLKWMMNETINTSK